MLSCLFCYFSTYTKTYGKDFFICLVFLLQYFCCREERNTISSMARAWEEQNQIIWQQNSHIRCPKKICRTRGIFNYREKPQNFCCINMKERILFRSVNFVCFPSGKFEALLFLKNCKIQNLQQNIIYAGKYFF